MTLPALLDARAAEAPHRIALEEKRRGIWTGWTWVDFARAVQGVASALHARGFAPGDQLIVMGEASVAWIVADLAAQRLGGASVTPSPDMAQDDLAAALREVGARFAAVDGVESAALVAAITGLDPATFFLLRPEAGAPGAPLLALSQGPAVAALPDHAIAPKDVATIAFGRDGDGRIVPAPLTHDLILRKASAVLAAADAPGGVHALVQVPLAHPAERVAMLAAWLLRGGKLSFPERADTVGVDLAEARPRLLSALPWQWRALRGDLEKRLLGAPRIVLSIWAKRLAGESGGLFGRALAASLRRRLGLASVKRAVSHGEGLAPEDLRVLRALGLDVVEGYGVAATGGWSLMRRNSGLWVGIGGATVAVRAGRGVVFHDEGADWPADDLVGLDVGPFAEGRRGHAVSG